MRQEDQKKNPRPKYVTVIIETPIRYFGVRLPVVCEMLFLNLSYRTILNPLYLSRTQP